MSRSQARPLARREAALQTTEIRLSEQVERELGGRATILLALETHPDADTRHTIQDLCSRLADPANHEIPLLALLAEQSLNLGDLLKLYRQGELARSQTLASRAVAAKLPAVAEDVMRCAVPHEETCGTCRGCRQLVNEPTPEVPNPEPFDCPDCGGTGIVVQAADKQDREHALKLGGLLKDGNNVQIAMNQQTVVKTGGLGVLDRLVEASDQMLYGSLRREQAPREEAPPVDGELVPDQEPTDDTERRGGADQSVG